MQTLMASADEARRLAGDVIPLAGAPLQENRIGFTLRVPVGVVCAITPFNAPLNTLLHKLAPALAAGNSVVVKPASATPLTANRMVEILIEAGVPADLMALLHRSEEHTSELQSLMRISYAVFCLKKKKPKTTT